jgi:glycosyltransferase involved in cell wall biosynthesis
MVKISVVMSVYNGASSLARTVESVLAQTEPDFEFIIVDDGSTDETALILASYASQDHRIRIITQQNAGLTRALIRGCAEACGDVIARQDCGDRSHPDRFARQLDLMGQGHVLVSCATRFVSPEGDCLYVSDLDGEDVRQSLLSDPSNSIHGIPSHPSAMFSRAAYSLAGGYRAEFRTAQDLDLWIRLARLGTIGVVHEELVEVTVEPRGISALARSCQIRLRDIAVALRDGGDTDTLMATAKTVFPGRPTRRAEADGLYFIGKCLLRNGNPTGRAYLRKAIRQNPVHLRAWLSLLARR